MKAFKFVLKSCTLMAAVFLAIQSPVLATEFDIAGRSVFY